MTAPTSSTALSRKTPRSAEAPRPSPQAPPPATRARLAAAGRETVVQRFGFAARMRKVRAVYDRLLARN